MILKQNAEGYHQVCHGCVSGTRG